MSDIKIKHRDFLGQTLNEMGLTGEMAEVGCAFGGYARIVLNQWKGKVYHMVDCWRPQDPAIYKEQQRVPDHYEQWYQDCLQVAKEYPQVRVLRDFSVPAAKQFKDGQLDVVFIDANHAYGPVLADMDAWWPKVRIGGIMAGHDFGCDTNLPHWTEVEPAVKRWTEEHDKSFYVCPCSSWFIHKESP